MTGTPVCAHASYFDTGHQFDDLNPADIEFRRIVTFGEARDGAASDAVATFHVPMRSDDPKSGERTLLAEQVYVMTLRVIAADAPPARDASASPLSRSLLMETLSS